MSVCCICTAYSNCSRYLGLDAYLILRTSDASVNDDPGLAGNLLLERLVGARVELVSKGEYAKVR